MSKIAFSRRLSRTESMIGVLLALLIPVAAVGGMDFAEFAAMLVR